ncbi:MAG: DUF3999 family protein [Candidatus Omnitrophota bacterium]
MKNSIRIFSILVLAVCLAAPVSANEFLFYKELTAPENMEQEVGAATFDSQLYLNTDNDFANLRIYDAKDKEVPYLVRKLRGQEKILTESPVAMKILSLEELANNRLSIVLEIDDEKQKQKELIIPSDVIIKTSNSNFEKTVSVFGSDDKTQWQILCENQPIFDYSRFIDLSNTSVSFEKKPFKYYKIVIDNVAQALVSSFSQIFTKYAKGKVKEEYAAFMRYEGVLHIDKLDFISREEKMVYGEIKTVPYPLDIAKVTINEKDKTSDIYLNSQREPLTRILFSITDRNFKRKVFVEADNPLNPEANWIRLVAGELFNINAGDFHKENLRIDLPDKENRYKKYRVRIFNYDNAPIEVNSVQAEGSVHEVIFFPNNAKNLKAYYGGPEAKAPHYDVSSVLSEIPLVNGERWKIGEEKVNANADIKHKPIISPKKLLIFALVSMVIVLGYLIAISVKKVDEISK